MSTELPASAQPQEPAKKGFSFLALVSMLTGALTYFFVFFHSLIHMKMLLALILAPISALAAILSGHRAHRQIKQSNGTLGGKKYVRAGLIMGYLYYVVWLALAVLAVVLSVDILAGITRILGA
jgi:hypothetical protein